MDSRMDVKREGICKITVPPGMTLNTIWVEHQGGNFLFYSERSTTGAADTIENVDRERQWYKARAKRRDILSSFVSRVFLRIYPSVY
jgi:hypothetical protein